jgi:Alr-MurF fusion protein
MMMKINIDVELLLQIVEGTCLQNREPNTIVKQLLIDSRKLMAPNGAVFFAIQGKHHDGHTYISDLYNKGIRIFIVEHPVSIQTYPEATFIQVTSAVDALQKCAAYKRSLFNIPVIGITGSNAKTIVKEWLSQLLGLDHSVIKSPRSYNSQVGVPLSVWEINERHQYGIFEAGISTTNEMQALQKVIQPTIGIFTNIGSAHDQGFANRAEKINEKLKLFGFSKIVIYCTDQSDIDAIIQEQMKPCYTWSLKGAKAKVEYTITATNSFQTEVSVRAIDFSGSITIPFIDEASIENALHVATTLFYLGYSLQEVGRKIILLRAVEMRLALKEASNNCYVIDDSYNNDLAGLKIALDFLDHVKQSDKKTIIISDVLETGLSNDLLYREVALYLNAAKLDNVISIGTAIVELGEWYKGNLVHFDSTSDFLAKIKTFTFRKEIILVKGARKFQFEKIVAQLQFKIHETVLEINLDALVHNLNTYRSRLKPNTKIMCMVKAFSYGSGGFEIAQLLQYHGVDYLAVAYADEGVRLRENGITLPIMVMNPTVSSLDVMFHYQLEPEVYEPHLLHQLIDHAIAANQTVGIHLKIDTGMKRLGFEQKDMASIAQLLVKHKEHIRVLTVFTHLAASDSATHDDFTQQQLTLFDAITNNLTTCLAYPLIKHAANSSGILRFPQAHYDMVRLGIGLYGVESAGIYQNELLPISVFKTHISQIKEIGPNETVGYSRNGKVIQHSKIATIAVGYADGYDRRFGNGIGEVLINGVRCPIIGNVCMDMCMVDVTNANATAGDEVILFGENPSVSELAEKIQTISYEVLTGVGERVKRIFYSE